MQLEHSFTVPVPVDQAWPVLLDVERIAPCLPGASVTEFDGETATGKVKVKVGPIQITYTGTARFVERDEAGRRAVIEASGKESRGAGTASATVTTVLAERGGSTLVSVVTDLAVTGKPAQFGRGVMADVGAKLVERFAECLGEQLRGTAPAAAAPVTGAADAGGGPAAPSPDHDGRPGSASPAAAATVPASGAAAPPTSEPRPDPPADPGPAASVRTGWSAPTTEAEPLDLLQAAGGPVAKRAAPVAAVLLGLLLLALLRRRRSR